MADITACFDEIDHTGLMTRGSGSRRWRPGLVQASLKLVLEPIFEADFKPCAMASGRSAELQIYAGTDEIQITHIAKDLLRR